MQHLFDFHYHHIIKTNWCAHRAPQADNSINILILFSRGPDIKVVTSDAQKRQSTNRLYHFIALVTVIFSSKHKTQDKMLRNFHFLILQFHKVRTFRCAPLEPLYYFVISYNNLFMNANNNPFSRLWCEGRHTLKAVQKSIFSHFQFNILEHSAKIEWQRQRQHNEHPIR